MFYCDIIEKCYDEILEIFIIKEFIVVFVILIKGCGKLFNVKVFVVMDFVFWGIDIFVVCYVIFYDVLYMMIDFIYCFGCVGCMGCCGCGIVLVGNDDRKDVVVDVKRSMFEG